MTPARDVNAWPIGGSLLTVVRDRPGNYPWLRVLLFRAIVCLVLTLSFAGTQSAIFSWIMLIFSVVGLRSVSARSPLVFAVSLAVILQAIWVFVAAVCAGANLLPIGYTPIRWVVYTVNADQVLLISSCFLYLLSTVLVQFPIEAAIRPIPFKALVPLSLLGCFIVSYLINRDSFALSGGYSGNENEYWSGLPAVFVVLVAIWCLSRPYWSLVFFIQVNLLILYWLSTGNRSEVLTIFIWFNTTFLASRLKSQSRLASSALSAILLLLSFVVFSIIGLMRGGLDSGESVFSSVFNSIFQGDRLNISTVGSSVYSSAVALDIVDQRGIYWGETFYGQLVNSIPSFIDVPWGRYINPFFLFNEKYQILGGFGLVGESYLNFGVFGPLLVGFMLAITFRILALRARVSAFSSMALLATVFYAQRFIFYGYVYLHNLIVLLLAMALVVWLFKMSSRRTYRGTTRSGIA